MLVVAIIPDLAQSGPRLLAVVPCFRDSTRRDLDVVLEAFEQLLGGAKRCSHACNDTHKQQWAESHSMGHHGISATKTLYGLPRTQGEIICALLLAFAAEEEG